MNENQIDKMIKEKLNTENINVSKDIDLKINAVLESLPKRKKKNNMRKVAVIAAICVVSTCFMFPSYAKKIPVIESVFEFFSETALFNRSSEYKSYAQNIEEIAEDKGIKFTIKEIACDDSLLVISYAIESDREITISEYPDFDGIVQCDGQDLDWKWSDNTGKWIDKNTYVGFESYYVSGNSIPENFNLDYRLRGIDEQIYGKWDFKLNISKEETNKNTKSIKRDEKVDLPNGSIETIQMTLSPFNNIISVQGMLGETLEEAYNYFVLDENEKNLPVEPYMMSWNDDDGTFNVDLSFISEDSSLNTYTLIPYLRDNAGCFREVSENVTDFPIRLSQGNGGEIIVTKAEKEGDNIRIYYRLSGLAENPHRIFILDENEKKINSEKGFKLVDYENQEYVQQFTGSKLSQFKIGTYKTELDIFDEYAISISVD